MFIQDKAIPGFVCFNCQITSSLDPTQSILHSEAIMTFPVRGVVYFATYLDADVEVLRAMDLGPSLQGSALLQDLFPAHLSISS